MKRFLLSATAAAIVTGWTGVAVAAVDLDTGLGLSTYASELITNNVTTLTGAAIDVGHKLGFGVSNTQTRFIRYTLTNGVFANGVAPANLTVGLGDFITVAQGGGAGQNFVIFQYTAGSDQLQTQAVAFALGTVGVKVTNKSSSVLLNYQLYETAANAAAGGTTGLLASANNAAVGIGSGLTFTTTLNTTTAEVADEYKKFNNGISTTLARIGTLTYQATPGVLHPAGGAPVVMADLVAAGSNLVITTDSNWNPVTNIADVYVSTDAACGGSAYAATSRTVNTTAIVMNTNESPTRGICYQANGVTPIEAQNFTITANVVPAAGTDTSNRGPIGLGNFNRNGTVLKAAFAETAGSGTGFSTSANMTNLGAAPAPYTVRCLTNTGSVAGTPGTIPAGTAVRYGVTSTLGCPSTGTLRGIELTFAVPEGRVIGSVVRQNVSTGQASFDNMIGSK